MFSLKINQEDETNLLNFIQYLLNDYILSTERTLEIVSVIQEKLYFRNINDSYKGPWSDWDVDFHIYYGKLKPRLRMIACELVIKKNK